MSVGMKLHPRHRLVTTARLAVQRVILEELVKHDLTEAEKGSILLEALHDELRWHFVYEIRFERHGDYEHKADEASPEHHGDEVDHE